MRNDPVFRLGNLQLQIVRVLWRLGPASAADVHQALSDQVRRSMFRDLIDRLFAGSLSTAISRLLEVRDISPDELIELEHLIRQHKQSKDQQ